MNAKLTMMGTTLIIGLLANSAQAIGPGAGTSLGSQAAGRANRMLDSMQQRNQQKQEQQQQQQQQQQQTINTDTPEDKATARMLEEANPTDQQLQKQQPNPNSGTAPRGSHPPH